MRSTSKISPQEAGRALQAMQNLGARLDGDLFKTATSVLCPVIYADRPAFFKMTDDPAELLGARALEAWAGNGAVKILTRNAHSFILERAGGTLRDLVADDASATSIFCTVASRLHEHSPADLSGFPHLRDWFVALFDDRTPRFDVVRVIAGRILGPTTSATPDILLHGDLHHANILAGKSTIGASDRGWLAIDPKGVVGPREFDYCNLFTNWSPANAHQNFDARLTAVSEIALIDRVLLLEWIASWSALSGIWANEDGDRSHANLAHSITELALTRLGL